MREILFRGKPKNQSAFYHFSNIWKDVIKDGFVFGSLIVSKDRYYICVSTVGANVNSAINNGITSMIEVIPETVGQYTGLTDKSGKKIFEGDICSFVDFHSGSDMETYCEGIWNFEDGQFYISDRLSCDTSDLICEGVFDGYIIGNIHDNPELLKEADNE